MGDHLHLIPATVRAAVTRDTSPPAADVCGEPAGDYNNQPQADKTVDLKLQRPCRSDFDTNICIYLMKHQPPQVAERFSSCMVGEVLISAITAAELEYGVLASGEDSDHNRAAMDRFLWLRSPEGLRVVRIAAAGESHWAKWVEVTDADIGSDGRVQVRHSRRMLRFNAEQLWQNLIRQGWQRVPPQW